MKIVPSYHTGNTETVNAYQEVDLVKLKPIIDLARQAWYAEFLALGAKDEGSCVLGNGIEVWYLKKWGRFAKRLTIISPRWCQGNLAAQYSMHVPLSILKNAGVEDAVYDDGRMD